MSSRREYAIEVQFVDSNVAGGLVADVLDRIIIDNHNPRTFEDFDEAQDAASDLMILDLVVAQTDIVTRIVVTTTEPAWHSLSRSTRPK